MLNKGDEDVSREKLEQFITKYLQKEPSITDKEFMDIIKAARENALLESIPEYEPIEVSDKKEILSEYEEKRKRLERKQYKDESTEEFD